MLGSAASRRQLLQKGALFSRLGDSEADAVLAHAIVTRYKEGVRIFSKGDPGNSMMAVLEGRVMISAPALDGRQVVLSVVHPGEVFGEIALLDGKERTADATATAACEVLVVTRAAFLSVLRIRPDLCIDLLVILCERIRRTDEQVEDLVFLDLETRIAKTLMRLSAEQPKDAVEMRSIKISQRELGEIVGGSRESVNKHLQGWKRSGIIAIEKGAIVIRDPAALAACV